MNYKLHKGTNIEVGQKKGDPIGSLSFLRSISGYYYNGLVISYH
jgi:hypothetical protein